MPEWAGMTEEHKPKQRFRFRGIVCIYTMSVAAAGVLFADAALAATTTVPSELNTDFWVRTLLGVLLAFIAYYTRGIENRVKLTEYEIKQVNTSIGMIRESMYRDYHNKQDIEKHWEQVQDELHHIAGRLDYITQLQVRSSDAPESSSHRNRRGTDK